MHHSDWFKLRYILQCDYPKRMLDVGSVLYAFEFEGEIKLDNDRSIDPERYKTYFRKLVWYEHRTIEQLSSIRYVRIIDGSNYYITKDVVEVSSVFYNDISYIGYKDVIGFSLKGHNFLASQLEPATKKEHDEYWEKEYSKIK